MRISPKSWRWLGLGLLLLVALGACIRTWVVPALIVRQIRAHYDGDVAIRDWWLDGRSAGVVGLTLREGPTADSPAWAVAERVATDLSLGAMLRGRFAPRRIAIRSPRLTFRIDREGRPLTRPPFKPGGASVLPALLVESGRVTFRQEGRPEMTVSGVDGRLDSRPGEARLSARANDPTWGPWEADGRIDPAFRSGQIALTGPGVSADPDKLSRVPFVPDEVWRHFVPRGPVTIDLDLSWGTGRTQPIRLRTLVGLRRTTVGLPTLGLTATETTGRLAVEDGVVRLEQVAGRSIGGRVAADGTLDFHRTPPRFDLELKLDGIDVAQAPKSWRLEELEATGRLTGTVQLVANLGADGVDLTGTTGEAVVEGGTLQGIPVKSLRLVLRAERDELKYETGGEGAGVGSRATPCPLLPLVLVAFQAPAAPGPAPSAAKGQAPEAAKGFRLPRSITTEIELADVDLTQVLARVEAMGIHLPVPVAGRLSLKAKATIPLGALRDVKAYEFHGQASLSGASIAGLDLGRLLARLDLADGILELTDFRGQLVSMPEGGLDRPPAPTEPVPEAGPLPPGGFRARLRAELSPPGKLTASLEGTDLPIGELAAPALPRPTPLSGLLTIRADAEGRVASLADPKSWTASGRAESARIAYRGSTLDAVSTGFRLEAGRLELPDLAAQMAGKPLQARLGVDLAAPHAFSGRLDVTGWSLADLLAFVPKAPRPAPVAGLLAARAEAEGTLVPLSLRSRGVGRLDQFRAGPVPLGAVPFQWTTERDVLVISGVEAQPFGGRLAAEARLPLGGGPIEGTASIEGIDTALLSAALPGGELQLAGKANGRARFVVDAGVPAVEADVRLSAPDLTVQGLPAEDVQAAVKARDGTLTYELTAVSLGGKVRLRGDVPLGAADPTRAAANAEFQVAGFTLGPLWTALGMTGPMAQVDGRGAFNSNVRIPLADLGLRVHGVAELRDLRWGAMPLGHLRTIVALTPTSLRVEPVTGELLGGTVQAAITRDAPAQGPDRLGFDVRIDRVALAQALNLAMTPTLAQNVSGNGSLRVTGRLDSGLRADAELLIGQGRIYGLPLAELRLPATVVLARGSGNGTLQVRGWTARMAGGQLRGDAQFRLGDSRVFQLETHLTAVDLETLVRIASDTRQPSSGKVSGRINLSGPDPSQPRQIRGKVDLDLDDASLLELPVFRAIERFLGSARGGIFEDGDLNATIVNGQIVIDQMTLLGRVVQLHASGTIGFDTQLNLEVLINTNQIIPQTGQSLIALIPGLGDVLGRRDLAIARVAGFLSNRLIKLRVTGTLRSPSVNVDPAILVTEAAVGFFAGAFDLPLGLLR